MLEQKPDDTVAINKRVNQPFKLKLEDKDFIVPSWKEAHKYASEAMKWFLVEEGLAQDMATARKNALENTFEAFRRAPAVDSSFGESPIGPAKQLFHLKAYLKKCGWHGVNIRDVLIPEVEIEKFSVAMGKAMKWIFKFEDEKIG